jgi:hypothetical protein
MGAKTNQINYSYFTVLNGKFVQRVKEGTPNAEKRKNKNDVIVYELFFDTLEGRLISIDTRVGDYGKEIHFIISDGKETMKLQQPFSSTVSKSYLSRILNCNLKGTLEFCVGFDKEKERTFAYLRQDGQTVKSLYTKDNPNGLPEMKKIKVKGQETWDDSDQLEFFDKLLTEKIIPKLKELNHIEGLGIITPPVDNDLEKSDDLPF